MNKQAGVFQLGLDQGAQTFTDGHSAPATETALMSYLPSPKG